MNDYTLPFGFLLCTHLREAPVFYFCFSVDPMREGHAGILVLGASLCHVYLAAAELTGERKSRKRPQAKGTQSGSLSTQEQPNRGDSQTVDLQVAPPKLLVTKPKMAFRFPFLF